MPDDSDRLPRASRLRAATLVSHWAAGPRSTPTCDAESLRARSMVGEREVKTDITKMSPHWSRMWPLHTLRMHMTSARSQAMCDDRGHQLLISCGVPTDNATDSKSGDEVGLARCKEIADNFFHCECPYCAASRWDGFDEWCRYSGRDART